MLVRIVGLGPGDPQLLTLGSVDALRNIGRAVTLLAPPDLTKYLTEQGITIVRHLVDDPALIVRGGIDEIERFAHNILRHAQDDEGTRRDESSGTRRDESAATRRGEGTATRHDESTATRRDESTATVTRHGELVEPRLGIGVLGNPLSDFPGLPPLLRALEKLGIRTEIVPGMPRATLSASITMPLVPLPPASAHHSWDDLIEIMARLRASCPWDREQTHRTLVPYLVEETYEVVEAIEQNDEAALCEELGDLLLQIVFHAQLGSETGKFTVADVVDALSNKMVRRHPHVFGDAVIEDVDAQWKNWEKLKSQEATGQKRKSRLDGIPKHLGALQRGQRMQEKASRVGFDWPAVRDILDKLQEELTELAEAQREKQDDPHVREELGDVFFTLVNLSRAMGIDAETAMREANEKFYKRFSFMEERAAKDGKALSDMSIDELEELWQLAKTQAA